MEYKLRALRSLVGVAAGHTGKIAAGLTSDLETNPWFRTGRVETSYTGLGISDAHGIWLGGSAIYLYQHGKGLTKVAAFPGFPANGCL